MSVQDNLMIAADDHSVQRYFADLLHPGRLGTTERVQRLIVDFRLGPVLALKPAELSHGTARRVGVARAMVAAPSVLFLDEPMAGLDVSERFDLGQEIRSVANRQGISVVLVEHDVALVLEICDRIVVLDFGEKIAEGSPDEIRRDPAVIAAYLGEEQPAEPASTPPRLPGVPPGSLSTEIGAP
jgi:sulfate-transporting ATPase